MFKDDVDSLKKKKNYEILKPDYLLKRLLTISETAYMLGVQSHTLRKWVHTQKYDLPYVQFGTELRFNIDDIIKFIERNTKNRGIF
jgi:excisionase family DNA binding protein